MTTLYHIYNDQIEKIEGTLEPNVEPGYCFVAHDQTGPFYVQLDKDAFLTEYAATSRLLIDLINRRDTINYKIDTYRKKLASLQNKGENK